MSAELAALANGAACLALAAPALVRLEGNKPQSSIFAPRVALQTAATHNPHLPDAAAHRGRPRVLESASRSTFGSSPFQAQLIAQI